MEKKITAENAKLAAEKKAEKTGIEGGAMSKAKDEGKDKPEGQKYTYVSEKPLKKLHQEINVLAINWLKQRLKEKINWKQEKNRLSKWKSCACKRIAKPEKCCEIMLKKYRKNVEKMIEKMLKNN